MQEEKKTTDEYQFKLPTENEYRIDDMVGIFGLKDTPQLNGKHAKIIGCYDQYYDMKWPCEITITNAETILENYDEKTEETLILIDALLLTFSNDMKPQTKSINIKPQNLKLISRGTNWIIDTNDDIQKINLLMKAYIEDIKTFIKLTSRQQTVFDSNFYYIMHNNLLCNGIKEFDNQLNIIKNTVGTYNDKLPTFLIENCMVSCLNEELTHFEVIYLCFIGNGWWKRIAELKLNENTKLVCFAKVKSMEIISHEQFLQITRNETNENENDNQYGKIVDAINNKD
eukprot:6985_1